MRGVPRIEGGGQILFGTQPQGARGERIAVAFVEGKLMASASFEIPEEVFFLNTRKTQQRWQSGKELKKVAKVLEKEERKVGFRKQYNNTAKKKKVRDSSLAGTPDRAELQDAAGDFGRN